MTSDYSKSADFHMENGWDVIPVSERERFYVKFSDAKADYLKQKEKVLKAANARHKKRTPKLTRIIIVVCVVILGIVLFLSSCRPSAEASRRRVYKNAIKEFEKGQKRQTRFPGY